MAAGASKRADKTLLRARIIERPVDSVARNFVRPANKSKVMRTAAGKTDRGRAAC